VDLGVSTGLIEIERPPDQRSYETSLSERDKNGAPIIGAPFLFLEQEVAAAGVLMP
jgi:hypothetical protein